MRAAVLTGIKQVRIEDRPEPEARPGWVVVARRVGVAVRHRQPPVRRPDRHPVPARSRPRLRRPGGQRRRRCRRGLGRRAGGGQTVVAVRRLPGVRRGQAVGLQEEEAHRAVVGRLPHGEGGGAGGQPRAAARGRRGVAGVVAGAARRRAQHRRPAADHARRDGARARAGPDRARPDPAVRPVRGRAADRHRRPGRAVRGLPRLRRDRLHQRRRRPTSSRPSPT